MVRERNQGRVRRSRRIAALISQSINPNAPTPLLDLPNELLCHISTHLQAERDIFSLAQVNSRLYHLTIAQLYRFNAVHSASSALVWSATYGRIEAVKRALKERLPAKSSYESEDDESDDDDDQPVCSLKSAFVCAAANNHENIVRLLVENGASPNAGDKDKRRTAIQIAAEKGHTRIVQLLLELGGDPGMAYPIQPYAIQYAAMQGHNEIVRLFIDAGESPDSCSGRPGGGSFTPLQAAAKTNNTELAKLLLSKGVKINSRAAYTDTPLELAVRGNHLEFVRLLLGAGAKVYSGFVCPIGMAKARGNKEMIELLQDETVHHRSFTDEELVVKI